MAASISTEEFLGVVADRNRWQLLTALAESDHRVGELVELTGAPQSLVSYHLAQLRGAGLISGRRSSADGRDTYYRAELRRCADLFARTSGSLHPGLELVPATQPGPTGRTARVLFLCTGNSARSQMAEALTLVRSGGGVKAFSAGSHPKPLHPHAVRAMADRGIDIAGRPTKRVSRFARSRFDRVVTLCDKVKEVCPELPGRPALAHWSMADPAAEDYRAFVRTADEIEERVGLLIAHLATEPNRQEKR